MTRLAQLLFAYLVTHVAGRRPPNFVVGADSDNGAYLMRWFLTPWRDWQHRLGKRADANPTWWNRATARMARWLPNLYLHKFLRDDDDRALHDHPSWAVSFILRNGYTEHTIREGGIHKRRFYGPGSLRFLPTTHAHRIELLREIVDNGDPIVRKDDPAVPCWSLFLFGPTVREWGFHCPERGWVHWKDFTAAGKPGEIGPGCDA
ncbi:hypothetical protein [Pseudoxanthomonas indica]|uniref:Uncharacterized protein n=1 Tax=Pseudoxanthomonas indica TaxID=428993 RepID=A0A1T5K1S4_9GAMM|nr:hypothetical protein [Pseudoxanthomonas indica]GGD45901.1 hypothetical protein GCM10007235_17360 [Pseudoxanthomonas indica]SKC57475.1 hypothetical protein SAMN06296058_1274 [Pseudoxanthomonas indica]